MALQDIYKKASLVMKPAAMKEGKLYSQQPHSGDGDFTFSRANGTQTRINKHGLVETVDDNTPRLSYELDSNGNVSECPALLLEPTRTNYLTNSNNASLWGQSTSNGTVTTTPNYSTAPNGSNEATRFQASVSGGSGFALLSKSTTSFFGDYSTFVYLKSNTGSNQEVCIYGRNTGNQVVTVTSEWQKFELNGSSTSGQSNFITVGVNLGFVGEDNPIDVLIWGGQIEEGSYATSLIPTGGSTEVRNVDDFENTGGVSLSGDFTYFVHIKNFDDKTLGNFPLQFFFRESASPFSYFRFLLEADERWFAQLRDNNAAVTRFNASGDALSNLGDNIKLAFAKSGTSCKYYVNGTLVLSSTITDFNYTFNRINHTTGNDQATKLSQVTVFKEALSDSELITLTT